MIKNGLDFGVKLSS